MKKKHKRYYSTTKTILVDSKRPITLARKDVLRHPREAKGRGVLAISEGLSWLGNHMNNDAINREFDKHMANLEIGEKKTIMVSFGGGKAKTIFQAPGHSHILEASPRKPSQTLLRLTGRPPSNRNELSKWIENRIKDPNNSSNKNMKILPADIKYDDFGRDRGGHFNDRGIGDAPRGDFNTGRDRDTMWA